MQGTKSMRMEVECTECIERAVLIQKGLESGFPRDRPLACLSSKGRGISMCFAASMKPHLLSLQGEMLILMRIGF